jgi:hypothetical protein
VLALVALAIETLMFAASFSFDEIFDEREKFLRNLDTDGLRAFAQGRGDPVLGWTRQGPETVEALDCQGNAVVYRFDADGARVDPKFVAADARVIAVGDSYTVGAEVEDAGTWPARLAARLGVPVVNHGVGGYDPVQSVLRLDQKAALYPRAEVAVLGIMYENVHRLVNSYRPVLKDDARPYLLKPYMAHGVLVPHPGLEPLEDFAVFLRHAHAAFDDDFWARPRRRFPYTLAFVRGLRSNAFVFRELPYDLRDYGVPEYAWTFEAERFRRELIAAFDHFVAVAQRHGLQPVVVFFPRNRFDTSSASSFLATQRQRFPAGLVAADAGAAAIDWDRYNLEGERSGEPDLCHPSAYGYDALAEGVAQTLRANGLVPH